ncbi:MAG: hypothetical protein EOP48_14510, partial [Sphingobacteriales bacterium]
MSLRDIQSIDKATDRELLLMILSTQVQLARRIEFLEAKIKDENFGSVPGLCDDIVQKFDTFNDEDKFKNSSLNTSSVNDRTFDRLYRQHQTKRQASIENEFKKRALEVKDCTFQPSLSSRTSQRSTDDPDRYNKLYKMHAEKQRNLMKKRIDKSMAGTWTLQLFQAGPLQVLRESMSLSQRIK